MTPDKYTNQELFLDVGNGHQIYAQDWGKADAKIPVFYLHGGPGNGCDNKDKQKFDPGTQRVIFHDQRGAGKSLPKGELDHNTTANLIEDINRIADKLNIKKFVLSGGSWGSTLALAYATAHPDRVAGTVIDGVFTSTQEEIDWLEKGGWRTFFPELWDKYITGVPASYQNNPGQYLFKRILSDDTDEAKRAAYTYMSMEIGLLKLDQVYDAGEYEKFDPDPTRIEVHYLANSCFMQEGHIQKNAHKLRMPIWLVQGRYDMVCPPQTAYELHQKLPNSQLIWTINGHLKQHEAKNIHSLIIQNLTGEV